jgi:transcriptional regulator GlxA family with amidase domain
MTHVDILLFNAFETLDAMGPAEVFGRFPELYTLSCRSLPRLPEAGMVRSGQNIEFAVTPISGADAGGILLVPGGMGTRPLVKDEKYVAELKKICEAASYVLTVCTGSALLAKTGLLDKRCATTNKIAFDWVSSQGKDVKWLKHARWVVDGKYYTSSGVSAGIDMALGFIRDLHGKEAAAEAARQMEYLWHDDENDDPFAVADSQCHSRP